MKTTWKRLLLTVTSLFLGFTLTACDAPGLVDELLEMAVDWNYHD